MSTVKKFKFFLNDVEFILPIKHLVKFDYNKQPIENPYIYGNRVAAASIIKQYVTKKYPKIQVNTKSDSFSGGNSVDVHISDQFGEQIDKDILDDINSFAKMFQYGKFNGMNDSYEMNKSIINTDKGTKIDPGVKYISVYNNPMFGTVAFIVKILKKYMYTDENSDGSFLSLDESIKRVEVYNFTDVNIEKATKLINTIK